MNWTKYYLLIIALVLLYACTSTAPKSIDKEQNDSNHLIDVEYLTSIIGHDSVVIIDMRKPEEYSQGHIFGAINIWRPAIQKDIMPYDGMIAPKLKVEKLFSELGISNKDYLVIYDDKASCDAARLWWVLDNYGFQNTVLLDGGIRQWKKMNVLSQAVSSRIKTQFKFPKNHIANKQIDHEELNLNRSDSSLVLIDSRSIEEYNGDYLKKGAFDKGRIPGSINIDWTEAVNYEEGSFKNSEEILSIYSNNGVDYSSNIVVYCHSGVRSAHTTFVLTQLLGYDNVRNYDGSWIEWSYNKLPIERNDTTLVISDTN